MIDLAMLPKVELHCHIDGIVDPPILRQLAQQGDAFPVSAEALEAALPVTDYDTFWRWFEVADPAGTTLKDFRPVLECHIERLKAQNVVYAEIGVGRMAYRTDEAAGELRALRAHVSACAGDAVQVEFLAAIGRHRDAEQMERAIGRILPLVEEGLLAGVMVAGPEEGHPIQPFHRSFARLHEAGVGIEIHAGEWCGPESVWDALEYGFPDRIGHGVAVLDDPALIRRFQEEQIHIEMCPTSNLRTGSVRDIRSHPLRRAFDLGLNVGINTDDPGPFACSMTSEYELAAKELGFTRTELDRLRRNAWNARFRRDGRTASASSGPEPSALG